MKIPDSQNNVQRTSDILEEILTNAEQKDSITIGEFMLAFGDRAFGIAILMFSLPNSLPIPSIPGFSAVTGIPIMLIGIQLILGRHILWLPKRVANYRFSPKMLAKVMIPSLKYVRKIEAFIKPRALSLTGDTGEKVIGFFILIFSAILAMPIPFGNFMPGISITFMALGLVEKDGLLVFLGGLGGIISSIIISTAIIAGVVYSIELIQRLLA